MLNHDIALSILTSVRDEARAALARALDALAASPDSGAVVALVVTAHEAVNEAEDKLRKAQLARLPR